MDPVEALRRIAFLLERRPRADLPREGLPRRRPTRWPRCPPASWPTGRSAGHADRAQGRRAEDGARWPRRRCRDGAGLPRQARGRGRRAGRPRAGPRCGPRCAATCTPTPTGPTAAARSRRWRETARDLGHEYVVLTDHSPRLTVANGLSPERLRQQLDVVAELNERAGAVPAPHRHRGRHPRRRLARPGGRAAGPARRRGRQRALQAADGRRGHDPADGRRGRQPAHRRPRALHRAAASPGGAGHAAGSRQFDAELVFAACRAVRRRRRDQLPARSGSTRRAGCCGWRSRPAACSRSTPTRTRPASWTGSPTAASGPRSAGAARAGRQHPAGRRAARLGRPARLTRGERESARGQMVA